MCLCSFGVNTLSSLFKILSNLLYILRSRRLLLMYLKWHLLVYLFSEKFVFWGGRTFHCHPFVGETMPICCCCRNIIIMTFFFLFFLKKKGESRLYSTMTSIWIDFTKKWMENIYSYILLRYLICFTLFFRGKPDIICYLS